MTFRLRTRIAALYMAATGLLAAVVFIILYVVVHHSVYSHLDGDLEAESFEVHKGMVVLSDRFVFLNPAEWGEREHAQVEVNPTFLQVTDTAGAVLLRSSNLRHQRLAVEFRFREPAFFNTMLAASPVRQYQRPIESPTRRVLGYLSIAMPRQEADVVLSSLRVTLLVTFPLVLLVVFFTGRYIAGRSVAPVAAVTATAERITSSNLDERIPLPKNRDELYRLAVTLNQLLERLRDAVVHERQFTADASHELRTPLSAVRGTLEVLLRRPRSRRHYVEKIREAVGEVDRLSHLVEQLLTLARYERVDAIPAGESVDLGEAAASVIARMTPPAPAKRMAVRLVGLRGVRVKANPSMVQIMLENLLSNALKYSRAGSPVKVAATSADGRVICTVTDHGMGIGTEHLPHIFDRFYRADPARHSGIPGTGLGLAIVQRLAQLQGIGVSVTSTPGRGPTFTLTCPPAADLL